jgi:valyl-tRNA synthetase
MILFGLYKTGKTPFKTLFLTGLVKGTDGQKMSKSKRNFVPIDQVKIDYGTDSFRMNCFYQNKAGRAYAITPMSLKNFRNFNNKIWNASKFVMQNLEGLENQTWFEELDKIENAEQLLNIKSSILNISLEQDDLLMLNKMEILEKDFHLNMEKYRFGKVTEDLYAHFWHEYCDLYIEATKSRVWKDKETGEYKSTPESRLAAQATLYYCLKSYLRMLHPFIPFITEEVWQHLVENGQYKHCLMYCSH